MHTLGKYQILREIARSNDVVYEAIDPVVGRRVALKELVFHPNLSGAERQDRIQRFYREAKAAGKLTHPNIVTIYEVGEENGRHFIAMEYLEGQTLRDVLRVRGRLPIEEAVRVTSDLCSALEYAHGQGVVHRDVKPDNIYLLPDGRVKLADFGIARITTEPSLTADGQVFGTPSYMSPEQVAGQPVDGRSDLFSLGTVLYEMLTGVRPFSGDTLVTITYNIVHSQPDYPASIPPALLAVLQRALAKRPEERFVSAEQMSQALRDPSAMAAPPAPEPTVVVASQPSKTVPPAPAGSGIDRGALVLSAILLIMLALTAWQLSIFFKRNAVATQASAPSSAVNPYIPPPRPGSALPTPASPGSKQKPQPPPDKPFVREDPAVAMDRARQYDAKARASMNAVDIGLALDAWQQAESQSVGTPNAQVAAEAYGSLCLAAGDAFYQRLQAAQNRYGPSPPLEVQVELNRIRDAARYYWILAQSGAPNTRAQKDAQARLDQLSGP